jgi:pyruvate formate lyase activating enzyme
VAVFRKARAAGLKCCYISNGNGTPEVLRYLRPHLDAYKVDLKAFDDRRYRELGGVLERVTATIRQLKQMDYWVEIVTLLVPGFNDGPEELRRMAAFLAEVDPLMPWHITAFHADYKMDDTQRTRPEDLLAAGEIGRSAGLKYIYLGNMPGIMAEWEHTRCHHCSELLIKRKGFWVLENRLGPNGLCPKCQNRIPGIWK